MAEDGRGLWVYSTPTTFFAHDSGSQEHRRRRPVSGSWINFSVWRWKPGEKANRKSKESTELHPGLGCKLGSSVGDYVAGEAVQTEDSEGEARWLGPY